MKATTEQFRASVSRPHRVSTRITVRPPGGVASDDLLLPYDACSLTAKSGTGTRMTGEITLPPIEDLDLFEIATTPGAIFNILHGFRYSSSSSELLPLFTGEASTSSSPLLDGSVQLSLTDRWVGVERARFLSPATPPAGLRSQTMANLMAGGLAGALPQNVTPLGGSHLGGSTWDRDRTQPILDLATDGGLEAYIDADGDAGIITVRQEPVLDPDKVVWTIRSGDGGTLKGGTRTRPLDRLYNTVVVVPSDETQTWSAQVAEITDPNHPRYPGKIGTVPYFWSSPTITSASAALGAAYTILARVLGTMETLNVSSVANPALEPGDIIQVVKSGPVGQRLAGVHLIDGWTLDCVSGEMSIDTRATIETLEEVV